LQDPLLFYRLKQHFTAAAADQADRSQQLQHPAMTQPPPPQQQQPTITALWDNNSTPGLLSSSCNISSSSISSEAHIVEDFLRRYAAYGFDGKADVADSVVRCCWA
jgi:hypothetical protein